MMGHVHVGRHMEGIFDPKGRGGRIVEQIANLLATFGYEGVYVEYTPKGVLSKHDGYRIFQEDGVDQVILHVTAEPRLVLRVGVVTPEIRKKIEGVLQEVFFSRERRKKERKEAAVIDRDTDRNKAPILSVRRIDAQNERVIANPVTSTTAAPVQKKEEEEVPQEIYGNGDLVSRLVTGQLSSDSFLEALRNQGMQDALRTISNLIKARDCLQGVVMDLSKDPVWEAIQCIAKISL